MKNLFKNLLKNLKENRIKNLMENLIRLRVGLNSSQERKLCNLVNRIRSS